LHTSFRFMEPSLIDEDVVQLQHLAAGGDDDDPVARLHGGGALGDDDLAVPDDNGNQHIVFQPQIPQGDAGVLGGGGDGEFHGLRRAVSDAVQGVHHAALRVFHTAHHMQDAGSGDGLGGDDTVQTHGPGDSGIIFSAAFGDDLGELLLLGILGDDEVVLVPVGQGHKAVIIGHGFRLQQFLVGTVSADGHHIGEALAQGAAAFRVLLDDFDGDAKIIQSGQQIAGDLAAAQNKGLLHLGGVAAQNTEKLVQTVGAADEVELIPRLRDKGALGDGQLTVSLGGTEQQGQLFYVVPQRIQRLADEEVPLLQAEAHQLHLAAAEALDVGGGGEAQQAGDLDGGGAFGIDDQIDLQVLAQLGHGAGIFRVADAGDGVFGTQIFGQQTADHVHLVRAGGGHQQIGAVHTRFQQGGGGDAVAMYDHQVQCVGCAA